MQIERAGITFNVQYFGASRGGRYEPPENPSIEVHDWDVSDWDELAACFGTGSGQRVFSSVDEIAEEIVDKEYSNLLDSAEADARDDFDPDYYYDNGPYWG